MISHKPFYFIRHGETDWNKDHRAMGITNIPLNSFGKEQSESVSKQLLNLPIKFICHSPLTRAKETAQILNKTLNCELVSIEELKEFNLGTFAGNILGEWFDDWIKGALIPCGETFSQFINRSLEGINKALARPGPVLIVAHGGTYWAIQQGVQRLDLPDLKNCTLACFSPPNTSRKNWICSYGRP